MVSQNHQQHLFCLLYTSDVYKRQVQNRLEPTINNLDNVVENTTTAESRIRDTDMASEMVNYSKNNILAQADVYKRQVLL